VALILVPALVLIGVLGWATFSKGGTPAPGDQAPAFTADRLDGDGSLSLSDFEGTPVVINFWASWCAPCEEEAPILTEAHRLYGDDVAFVGVNIKDARSKALEFERKLKISYPSVRDEQGQIYSDYGLTGQPETFLLDADGVIAEHVLGPIPGRDYLLPRLDALTADDG
jgi:cytochrome c biogenesis protein CcmG, thiol:disulfide interchange protein DsbE